MRREGRATGATTSRRALIASALGVAATISAGLGSAPAEAQTPGRRRRALRRALRRRRRREADRRRARDAVESGAARPLDRLMRHFEREIGEEVLDVRYREVGRHPLYVFKTLRHDGRIGRWVVDAETGEIFTLREAAALYRGGGW